jgi:hypothetical protein
MTPYTQEQIEERFATLPPVVQEALGSAETGEVLRRIGSHHDLHIDQMGTLNDITVFVMLGLIPRNTYASTLAQELGISKEEAGDIVKDVNTEILTPISAALKQTTNLSLEDDEDELAMPTRDEILREIESPGNSPVKEVKIIRESNISEPSQALKHEENALTLKDNPEEISTKETRTTSAQTNILETKLRHSSHIPPTTSSVEETTSSQSSTILDPYREAIE